MSCAERIIAHPVQRTLQHSEDEILKRITQDLMVNKSNSPTVTASYLQFRLVLVQRQDKQLRHDVVFHSRVQALVWHDIK